MGVHCWCVCFPISAPEAEAPGSIQEKLKIREQSPARRNNDLGVGGTCEGNEKKEMRGTRKNELVKITKKLQVT